MHPVRLLGVALLATSVALVGCGDDGDDTAAENTDTTASTSATSADDTTTSMEDATTSTTAGDTAPPAQGTPVDPPPDDECVRIDENAENVYRITGVGEVELRRSGDALELVEARPEAGWQASGDEEDDPDEVEVDFRNNGDEFSFEAEIEDGRIEIELCNDD